MPIADCRLPNEKRIGPFGPEITAEGLRSYEARTRAARSAISRPFRPCLHDSAIGNRQSAFTLVEMLVVMAIIAVLAGMLTGVIIYARNLALRAQCQQNLNHIGQTVSLLVLSNNGLYPIGPPSNTIAPLSNAYPMSEASDTNPNVPNNSGFPWWARVFEQWEGDMGLLFVKNAAGVYATNGTQQDANFNPNSHMLTPQLPLSLNAFHCPAAGALDGSSVVNLFNSISYGINFDVKDAGPLAYYPSSLPRPYCANSPWSSSVAYNAGNVVSCNGAIYTCIAANSNYEPPNPSYWQLSPYSLDFPNNLNTNDKQADQYRSTEIQNPGQFILISEATTLGIESLPQSFPQLPQWSSSVQYIAGDVVSYNGAAYTCIAGNNGNYPPPAYPNYWKPGYWTGGRIGISYPTGIGYQRSISDMPPSNAPIIGRHSGYANILFGDYHVEAVQITSVPGQVPSASLNINYDYPKWTLPGK